MEKYGVWDLYKRYTNLAMSKEHSWHIDEIANSAHRTGHVTDLPILAVNNRLQGPAIWIFAGIHGEEPAGPNILARHLTYLTRRLNNVPTLILPLCNPHGYLKEHRYLEESSSNKEGLSVGDADHVLLDHTLQHPRRVGASSPEADRIMKYLLAENVVRPPKIVLDLHEDSLVPEGYVYSQGTYGFHDNYARAVIESMKKHVAIYARDGKTRFDEDIKEGIVCPVQDGSIDEFVAAKLIYHDNQIAQGIGAETVLTIETPAKDNSLDQRVLAQFAAVCKVIDLMRNDA